jgi:hypothetical protein
MNYESSQVHAPETQNFQNGTNRRSHSENHPLKLQQTGNTSHVSPKPNENHIT